MRELVRLLYGDEAEGAIQPDERLRRWAEAFDAWLDERSTGFSLNVGEDSYTAWKEFLAFTRKAQWNIQVEDVEAYIGAEGGRITSGDDSKTADGSEVILRIPSGPRRVIKGAVYKDCMCHAERSEASPR